MLAALAVVVLLAVYSAAKRGKDAEPLPGTPLRELGGDRRIGTAVRVDALDDDLAYRQLVAQQFSAVTPENEMKWALIEPEQGRFDFEAGDDLVRRAERYGQVVRGHTLVWHAQYPEWLDDLGPKALRAAVDEHIRKVVGHFGDRVQTWDVANEVMTDRGNLRRSVFQRRLGDGFVADAFRVAHASAPKAKLYINEIGADGINPKSDGLYALVRRMKAAGVPVDGVGFQGHFNLDGVPDGYRRNLERFAALGVDVAITESDVALAKNPDQADLDRQAGIYRQVVETCKAVPRCRSLTFWGFTDSRSWISETQAGFGSATLLNDELRAKPAYLAVQRALSG